MPISTVCVC